MTKQKIFHQSHLTIKREITRNHLKFKKRQKYSKYTATRLKWIPRYCRRLRLERVRNNYMFIVDNEKYFTFSNSEIKENYGF